MQNAKQEMCNLISYTKIGGKRGWEGGVGKYHISLISTYACYKTRSRSEQSILHVSYLNSFTIKLVLLKNFTDGW